LLKKFAGLDSPAFAGAPTAQTPDPADDSERLANTEWVNRAIAALAAPLPLAALPFPTIATTSNTISATGNIVAGQGGSVSVPAGVSLSLGQEVVVGTTGILAGFTTQAWTSGIRACFDGLTLHELDIKYSVATNQGRLKESSELVITNHEPQVMGGLF
jgi:hypothetical protein